MKRAAATVLSLALFLLVHIPRLGALDTEEAARDKYNSFLKQVQAGDLNLDWQGFRLAAEVCSVYGDFDWHPVRDRVIKEVHDGDSKKALDGAQEIISHNYADPEGHLLAMLVLQKMEKQPEAAAERAIVDHIVQSILKSGDGKSADTAYFTVNTSEEYFFIGVVLGGSPKSQALVKQKKHSYDEMTIIARDGKEQVVWFNTDTDMQKMAALFSDDKKK